MRNCDKCTAMVCPDCRAKPWPSKQPKPAAVQNADLTTYEEAEKLWRDILEAAQDIPGPAENGDAEAIAVLRNRMNTDRAAQRQAGREEAEKEAREERIQMARQYSSELVERDKRYAAVVEALKNVSEAEQSVAYQKTGFSEQLAILSMLRHCGEIARKALSELDEAKANP